MTVRWQVFYTVPPDERTFVMTVPRIGSEQDIREWVLRHLPEGTQIINCVHVTDCERQKGHPSDECGPKGVEGEPSHG